VIHAKTVADWPVARDGYHWIDAHLVNDQWEIAEKPTRVLTQVVPGSDRLDWTYPLAPRANVSALFRQLAQCEETEESIADFAATYGMLAYARHVVPVERRRQRFPKPPKAFRHIALSAAQGSLSYPNAVFTTAFWAEWEKLGAVGADTLDDWKSMIRDLKTMTRLSDAFVAQDEKTIVALINFKRSGKDVSYNHYIGSTQTVTLGHESDRESRTPLAAARRILLTAIGEKIEAGYLLELKSDPKTDAPSLALRAPTLRHVIWLQFALAIWENRVYRPCDVCGRFFLVSPDVARSDRTLCGQACKQKAHRKRHGDAIKLARRGLTPREIAKQIGSGVDTVTRWLQAEEGRKNDRQTKT
jgi:hypothetical protein